MQTRNMNKKDLRNNLKMKKTLSYADNTKPAMLKEISCQHVLLVT